MIFSVDLSEIFLIRSRCCAGGGVVVSSISIVKIARFVAKFYIPRLCDAANEHRLEDVVQISYFCDEFSSRMRGNVEIVRVRFFFSRSTR